MGSFHTNNYLMTWVLIAEFILVLWSPIRLDAMLRLADAQKDYYLQQETFCFV